MGIENLSDDIILVALPVETQVIIRELKIVNEIISEKGACDVVIDFSNVDVVTSSGISNLMIMRELLREHNRQLILCSVSASTMGVFTIAGLEEVFEFADDKNAALEAIQHAKQLAS